MKTVAFFIRQFSERGTEVSTYSYAHYNETILKNKSIVVCFTKQTQRTLGFPMLYHSYEKFKSRFPSFYEIDDIQEMSRLIEQYSIDFFYTQAYGGPDIYRFDDKTIWSTCKTVKHCVFDTRHKESDFYISISHTLNHKFKTDVNVIPYMVDLPPCTEDMRKELGLPHDAIVIGRHGGANEFNNPIAHEAIVAFLRDSPIKNTYFLFMNTHVFYEDPRIIYLERNTDIIYKTKFIRTCDAMIHARLEGETFGLAIAEFSSQNKPVITCSSEVDNEHIQILGDRAILYHSKEQLINIFHHLRTIRSLRNDWNAYTEYSPEATMKMFDNMIFTR